MKGLFVGARVRILYSENWPELAGQEGRIEGRVDAAGPGRWVVAPVIWGTSRAPRKGNLGFEVFAPNSDQLEPILPEGSVSSDLSFQQLMESLKTEEKVE